MMNDTEPVVGQESKQTNIRNVGRPRKLTVEQAAEVYEAFKNYIIFEGDPTVVGFCAWDKVAIKYEISRENLKDWPEFSPLIKRAIAKQEAYLLKRAGQGEYNATLAIFRLKQPQHGYKDRTETDVTSGGEKLMGVNVSVDQAEQLVRARAKRSNI